MLAINTEKNLTPAEKFWAVLPFECKKKSSFKEFTEDYTDYELNPPEEIKKLWLFYAIVSSKASVKKYMTPYEALNYPVLETCGYTKLQDFYRLMDSYKEIVEILLKKYELTKRQWEIENFLKIELKK